MSERPATDAPSPLLPPDALDTVEGRKLALHFLFTDLQAIKTAGLPDPESRRAIERMERRLERLAESMNDPKNTAAGALGGLTGLFKTALAGNPVSLLILLVGLPFTLLTLAFLVAAALGQAGPFIDGVTGLIHGQNGGVEITVEGSSDGTEGGSVQTDAADVGELNVEADAVNVSRPPSPSPRP